MENGLYSVPRALLRLFEVKSSQLRKRGRFPPFRLDMIYYHFAKEIKDDFEVFEMQSLLSIKGFPIKGYFWYFRI